MLSILLTKFKEGYCQSALIPALQVMRFVQTGRARQEKGPAGR